MESPQPFPNPFPPAYNNPLSPTARVGTPLSKLGKDITPVQSYVSPIVDEQLRASLPDLFKQKGSLQTLRPLYLQDLVKQRDTGDRNRAPKLLARLEGLLQERLALVNRMAAARQSFAVTQFRTDAYRQVFDAFLHSFTTYRSLLLRIKHEYDKALDDALASVYDNVLMNAELIASAQRQETVLVEAAEQAEHFNALAQQELASQLDEAQHRLTEAETRWRAAESELEEYQRSISELKARAAGLEAANSQTQRALMSGSTWAPLLQRVLGAADSSPDGLGSKKSKTNR